MKSISASPDGILLPGRHSLPSDKAGSLVALNYAEYADNPPVVVDESVIETATISAPESRAFGRKKK